MNVFCYARVAHQPVSSKEDQVDQIQTSAEQKGYPIISTGCSALDVKLMSMLQENSSNIQQAMIVFYDHTIYK